MTIFSTHTPRRARIAGNFPAYRRNAVYDSKGKGGAGPIAPRGGYWTDNDAFDDGKLESRGHSGAVVWRRSPAVAAPPRISNAFRLLWSVMMRVLRRFQPVSIVLFAILVAFLAGFVVFSEKVTGMQPPVIGEPADGIVVLTGGQSRVQAGIDLLKDKRGKRLLISGVHPATNEKALQRATHADAALFSCCVDLDRSALNTVGNAAESERWIRSHDYHRVIVVTNNYHIPRSILEMSYRMKDVEFIAYPVVNGERREHSWVSEGDTLRVLFLEYVKYLGAAIRVGVAELSGFDLAGTAGETG